MDYELFKSIVDEASYYGPRSFSLHLFGEPLLYPRIIDSIKYIKQRNRRNTVLLTTNGVLLNRYVKDLDASGVDRIIWSYRKNNFNAYSHSLLRRKGLIRLLIEETPKEEFEKWSRYPRVEIKHLHNYGGNIDTAKWGLTQDRSTERYPCYHLWLAPAIRWNGEITRCCDDPHGRASVGTYGQLTLRDYWTSSRLRTLREEQLGGKYTGICANCNVWNTYRDMFFGVQKHKCAK